MKTCPECGLEWAPKFKFCPEDGTPLPADAPDAAPVSATSPSKRPKPSQPATGRRLINLEPAPSEAPAPRAARAAPAPAPEPAPAPTAAKGSRAVRGGSAAFPRPEPKPQRLVKDASSRASARVKPDDPTSQHESLARSAPTQLLEAVSPEMTHETRKAARPEVEAAVRPARSSRAAPAPEPEPEPAPAPKPSAKKPAKKQRDFSETAWFMRQPNPEDADPNTGKVKVDKKAYVVEEEIPEERRRKFSLRRKDED